MLKLYLREAKILECNRKKIVRQTSVQLDAVKSSSDGVLGSRHKLIDDPGKFVFFQSTGFFVGDLQLHGQNKRSQSIIILTL